MRKTHIGPGVSLVLDPGNPDTPAIVYNKRETASATYNCAVSTGELTGINFTVGLTPTVLEWLAKYEDEVDTVYSIARKGMKEYQ